MLVVIHVSITTCPAGEIYLQKCELEVGYLKQQVYWQSYMDFFDETQDNNATNTTSAMEENKLVDLVLDPYGHC